MRRLTKLVLVAAVALASGCAIPTAQQPGAQTASGARSSASPSPPTSTIACPSAGPSPRGEVGAAYDPIHKVTVVFGGDLYPTPTTDTKPTAETWTFDGRCWQLLHPVLSPSARQASGGMVFDPAVGKALLVGGRAAGPYPADAWLWDGANWTQLTGAPRFGNVNAVYDEARKVVVVYGEFTSSANPLYSVDHFTWTWDGSNWLKQSPAHMPPPRSDAQMCYDKQSQTTLLFGGYAVEALGDTWKWNGNDWSQVHPTLSPPERWGAALMCGGGRVVLAGGDVRHAPAKDVWSWEGYNWTELTKSSLPDGLSGGAAVFDGTRLMVLLGIQESMPQHAEVWSFDGTHWSTAALS